MRELTTAGIKGGVAEVMMFVAIATIPVAFAWSYLPHESFSWLLISLLVPGGVSYIGAGLITGNYVHKHTTDIKDMVLPRLIAGIITSIVPMIILLFCIAILLIGGTYPGHLYSMVTAWVVSIAGMAALVLFTVAVAILYLIFKRG